MNCHPLTTSELPLQALLFLPENRDASTPLMVYLHGAGERGTKLDHLYRHGVPKLIQSGKEIPAIVLCPQCPAPFVWNNIVEKLKQLIDIVAAQYAVLPDRISITGSSMGGYGTWEMGLTYPNFFSAIAPVAGGGLSWRCSKLVTTPVLACHGTADEAVPFVYSQLMVDVTNQAGGDAQLIALEGFGHNDGINEAYFGTHMLDWLLAQRRTNFEYVKEVCEDLF